MSYLFYFLPEIFILSVLSFVIVLDLFLKESKKNISYYILQISLIIVLLYLFSLLFQKNISNYELYDISNFTNLFKIFTVLLSIIIFYYSYSYLQRFKIYKSEYFIILIFGLLGMMIMVSANHLLILYLGIELLSLSLYTIIAYNRTSVRSSEAAVKYYILGAMSSGFLLFGISLLYGITGSLLYDEISSVIESMNFNNQDFSTHSIGLIFSLIFILISIAFKFGAAPFHMWIPDVYEGSLTPTTLMISTLPKVAIFVILIKLTSSIFSSLEIYWSEMILILAVISVLIGNIIAISQTNIKRMLAYSTIANVGFILLGIYTGPENGYEAALFYTITYTLFTAAVFGLISEINIGDSSLEKIDDLGGLNQKFPLMAVMILIVMLSMIGIPPLLGFYAKFYVIQSLVLSGSTVLAIFAVIMTVIGSFYYLRVIKVIYFDDENTSISPSLYHLISYVFVLTLFLLGIFPNLLSTIISFAIGNL